MNESPNLLDTARRRREVVRLREQGLTWETIARRVEAEYGPDRLPSGWDRRYACKDFHRLLRQTQAETAETIEAIRQLELRRLDRMLAAVWPDMDAGDTDAARIVLKIMQRRARYLGLDEPERFEQAVRLTQSDEYVEARSVIMQALDGFPKARTAVAEALEETGS